MEINKNINVGNEDENGNKITNVLARGYDYAISNLIKVDYNLYKLKPPNPSPPPNPHKS